MCGRYVVKRSQPLDAVDPARFDFLNRSVEFAGTYNAAPTDRLPVYLVDKDGEHRLEWLRWDFIPSWTKELKKGRKPLINARAETVHELGTFKNAFHKRRCLVPMNGFYEWQARPNGKQPYFIHLLNEELFAVAGVYEWWKNEQGEWVGSFAIVTLDPNELVKNTHDRMPAILTGEQCEAWLDRGNDDIDGLRAMLRYYPHSEMAVYPVRPLVNNVRNDGSELLEPLASM